VAGTFKFVVLHVREAQSDKELDAHNSSTSVIPIVVNSIIITPPSLLSV
jgi:hypothetical protein